MALVLISLKSTLHIFWINWARELCLCSNWSSWNLSRNANLVRLRSVANQKNWCKLLARNFYIDAFESLSIFRGLSSVYQLFIGLLITFDKLLQCVDIIWSLWLSVLALMVCLCFGGSGEAEAAKRKRRSGSGRKIRFRLSLPWFAQWFKTVWNWRNS